MLKIKKLASSFFFLWFLIVSTCIYLGTMLIGPLAEFLLQHDGIPADAAGNDGTVQFLISFLLLVGLFMGLGQWIVINTKIKKAYVWILATLIGFNIGIIVSFRLFSLVPPFANKYYMLYEQIQIIVTFIGAGLFTGFCQWISLKRKIAGSLKWSLVNGLSFLIGILSFTLFILSFVSDYPVEHPIVRVISIIVSVGLVTLISGYFAEPLLIRPEIENITQQEAAI